MKNIMMNTMSDGKSPSSIARRHDARSANDGGATSPSSSSSSTSIVDVVITALLCMYTFVFVFFRIAELWTCFEIYRVNCISSFVGYYTITMLPTGRRSRYIYHVLSLMTIVYCLDHILPRSLPPPIAVGERNDGGNKIVVVTGANAGIGYETSRRLALDYGTTVIMGCRSKSRCDVASSAIRDELMKRGGEERGGGGTGDVIPMNIDLSDFDSVRSLASELRARRIVVDVLFNNAGYVPLSGTKVDENTGLETSFMSMHLGHFYLTELLLMDNPKLRIVNTSSGTHHICALLNFSYTVHSSMTKLITRWTHGGVDGDNDGVSSHGGGSCINDDFLIRGMHSNTDGNAYIRAKLANVMHVVELPRRHPTATAMVVDLGWVGTSIQPFMRGSVITPANLGTMRSARIGIHPVLIAILSSESELSKNLDVGRNLNDAGISLDSFGRSTEAFTAGWWWRDYGGDGNDMSRNGMVRLGERLWDESVKVLQRHGHLL